MDRGNILSGAAFSAVFLSATAFLVVLIIVGVMAHGYVERSVTEQMRDRVNMQWELFAGDYRDEGVGPLTNLIERATGFTGQGERALGLFDARGTLIVGNITTCPDATGWQEAPLDVSADVPRTGGRATDYLFRSGALDELTLVIGQRMDAVSLINRTMFRVLAVSGLAVVLTMLCVGYLFSRKSQRELEGLETTLARVSEGDTTARIVLSPGNDQIDRIAGRMNAHLDTLSRLTISTRATVASVAHDLKSPLARAYMGLGRALARVEAGEDPRAEIENTQAELDEMNGIFDTLLRLARIEAGGDGVPFAEVDLVVLLDDLADTYRMVAEDAGQSLEYEQSGVGALIVMGDGLMLQQMVVNLLQNAVTHGGDGNEIRLTLERDADHIRVTVADSGPGIPETACDAVFEPFHRLDPSRRKPGSGLGLSLVRAIAELHGARVTLSDNAPGLRVEVALVAASGVTASVSRA